MGVPFSVLKPMHPRCPDPSLEFVAQTISNSFRVPSLDVADHRRFSRVGLIGNMNNNNFAILRYLRDLGLDADLLLFENEIGHFQPECDTWSPSKWQPFIRHLSFGNNPRHLFLRSSRAIARDLAPYGKLLGCGLAPALAARGGRTLEVFYPYSPGVEYVDAWWMRELLHGKGWLKRAFYRHVRKRQQAAILRARHCTNLDLDGRTQSVLAAMGRSSQRIGIPMVYNLENPEENSLPATLRILGADIRRHRFVVLSHARNQWVRGSELTDSDWRLANKNNHFLLEGFAEFLRQSGEESALLVLFKYGRDVAHSRRRIAELGLSESVKWLPLSPRREIAYLMRKADVGVGEFIAEGIWGGTGWETLAAGRPLIQRVNYSAQSFPDQTGLPLPPICHAENAQGVARQLFDLWKDVERRLKIGRNSEEWFCQHQGLALAKRYAELLVGSDSDSDPKAS